MAAHSAAKLLMSRQRREWQILSQLQGGHAGSIPGSCSRPMGSTCSHSHSRHMAQAIWRHLDDSGCAGNVPPDTSCFVSKGYLAVAGIQLTPVAPERLVQYAAASSGGDVNCFEIATKQGPDTQQQPQAPAAGCEDNSHVFPSMGKRAYYG